ncbi:MULTISPECIES: ArsA family ATPase [Nocardia]|uniref:ArsA family ATPase n=1 Tax=Nocardia TaxID=1817 RepID=UPI001896049C|nr:MULTISPECIES: ArsA family ATPase [Nocardia]MBF6351823.1 ArsA family ATPase [Nocardia flavorosea]
MFVGKGGVGKTTLACAQAMGHARTGQRVLLASLDQAHSLGDALGFRFAHDPGAVPGMIRVIPGLEVIELDSLALLEDRFREIAGVLAADTGHDHGFDLSALDPAELTGLPGVQELLMLVEVTQYAADGEWDVIVLDCPPTADMLRILTAPETLLGYLDRIWPPHHRMMAAIGTDLRRAVLAATMQRIVAAVTEVRDLLADSERTSARLITLAERVAVAESARVYSATALLGLRLQAVVVNKVLPPVPPAGPQPQHPAVRWYTHRYAEQRDVIAGLRTSMPDIPVLVAGHTGAEPVGIGPLAGLACVVPAEDTGDPVSGGGTAGTGPGSDTGHAGPVRRDTDAPMRDDAGSPVAAPHAGTALPAVRLESGTGVHSVYALRIRLPVADPATLRLGRVEDDLIVGADGLRRRLRLAPVLRRCTVSTAELDNGYLVIRFRPDPQEWPR